MKLSNLLDKTINITARLLLGVMGVSFLAISGVAVAETVNCTAVTTLTKDSILGYTITKPGVYCLKADLTASSTVADNAITIKANDVVLDLNGFTITNGPTSLIRQGVRTLDASNVTIKNGRIRNFKEMDVCIKTIAKATKYTTGVVVENIRAEGCPMSAIRIEADDATVRNCSISNVGDSGIEVLGNNNRVLNNDVNDQRGAAAGSGIYIEGSNIIVANNRINNSYDTGVAGGGPAISAANGAIIVNNYMAN
jgi:hypothetical protein